MLILASMSSCSSPTGSQCPSSLRDVRTGACVETDGGADGGDAAGAGDGGGGGDSGFKCKGDGDCAGSGSKPYCVVSTGVCVECMTTSQCSVDATRPICDTTTNTCVPCTTDKQCSDKLGPDPGVCMFHQDGHCATGTESVYVKNSNVCPTPTDMNGGSVATPFCSLANAIAGAGNRRLFVVRSTIIGGITITSGGPFTIVGQSGAIGVDTGQPGIQVTGVDVYIRAVAIGKNTSAIPTIGIIADGGATIRLDGVYIENMPQGGLRVTGGAGYDVQNSVFAGNGMMLDDAGRSIGGAFLATPVGAQPSRFAFNTVVKNREKGVTCGASSQIIEASLLAGQTDGVTPFPDTSGCMVATTSKALGAVDPMLTSNYRITAGSPCVDFVPAPAAGAPNHDIDAVMRPQGAAFDCGASEFKP